MNIKCGNHLLDHGPDDYVSFLQTDEGETENGIVDFQDSGRCKSCGETRHVFHDSVCAGCRANAIEKKNKI